MDQQDLPTFAEMLTAATEQIAPTGRPVADRAREVMRLGEDVLRRLVLIGIDDAPLHSDNLHYDERAKELGEQLAAEARARHGAAG